MSKEISFSQIKSFNDDFYSKSNHLISQRAVMKNGILASSENQQSTIDIRTLVRYNTRIEYV